MATNAELAAENAALTEELSATREELDAIRDRNAELETMHSPSVPPAARRPVPVLPSFGISEGVRQDILQQRNELAARNRGPGPRTENVRVVEPTTGRVIIVTEDTEYFEDEHLADPDTDVADPVASTDDDTTGL